MDDKKRTGTLFESTPSYIFMHSGEENPSRFLHMRRCIDKLERLGETQSFPKNHTIIRAGKIPECCYLVKSGQVVAVTETESGNELFFCIMETNALFGEMNMLFERILPITFRTTVPTELIRIEKQALKEAFKNDSDIAMAILEYAADKFFAAIDENQKMKSHNATWRLCDLLLSLAEQYGVAYDNKTLIQKKFSIEIITSMLGVNRATTVRAIKSLKDLGLIETINGYYCIRDIELLKTHQETITSL
ncbi:Crp/Fnr family transcriptional regulator [Anaerovorax odorimutans]|uniref:Crp/Fnr family transcriptional regulator n=1 Tax=Anaerovorax odorimutans TaxID=109327 RepID=A0ABT1RPE5_9FIRM|nr:Crp/Fnr family transcriptional regulator [Anaerovorax odorimutans]MCQ4637043.1 Crp/Fnr family transcriptional regulator [Anaerovorax odorimutans]